MWAWQAPNGKGSGVGLVRGLLRPEGWLLRLVGLLLMVWVGALAGPEAGELVLAHAHGGAPQGVKRGSSMLGGVHGHMSRGKVPLARVGWLGWQQGHKLLGV